MTTMRYFVRSWVDVPLYFNFFSDQLDFQTFTGNCMPILTPVSGYTEDNDSESSCISNNNLKPMWHTVFVNLGYTILISWLKCWFGTSWTQNQTSHAAQGGFGRQHRPCGVTMLPSCFWDGRDGWSRLEHLILLLVLPVLFVNGPTRLEHITRTMRLYLQAADIQFDLLA